jgi:general secretion pathway protein E
MMVMNNEEEHFKSLAKKLQMPLQSTIDTSALPRQLASKIPYSFARKHSILPIEELATKIRVALSDPLNLTALEELRILLDKEVEAVCVPKTIIFKAQEVFYHQNEKATSEFLASLTDNEKEEAKYQGDAYDLLENKEETPIIQLLNLIFSEAIRQNASDIHFEPYEDDLKIRYRIDGVLQTRHTPTGEHQTRLLTRIKVLAQLDIAEHRLPQDGRMKVKMGGREIDFRVSTVPTSHGERIVLRILDKGNLPVGLENLGFLPSVLKQYRELLTLTEGIILVTGPTGSGKTTTLYSSLQEVGNDETNIMTIEDPVEYKLKGISQIAVHPKIGLTFAKGLRHILRQDPDIVMIGEIRDRETAEIAIQAALTGHLVFSTLHTNDAPSAIARLMDMGIEPYLLSATVSAVLAQRLIRRICPHCCESYTPSPQELDQLQCSQKEKETLQLSRGKGCASCFHSGYKGRSGIWELMRISDTLRSHIAERSSAHLLREVALKEKMLSLRDHGLHLVRSSVTTLAELLRVCKKEEV